ncbi:MAG: anhydro-N-acetylmuramic acid kinase [Xenophilus sp.]
MNSMTQLFIGLMSGTSLDGVDGVLAELGDGHIAVRAHAARPLAPALRGELLALNTPGGPDELHRAALAANGLVRVCAEVVSALLHPTGLPPAAVRAIGAHGQTVRHRPGEFDGTGYTLQLNNPALLAELTGIDVVADLRSRDVAAGGQGAPLVPAFHAALFARGSEGGVAVLNLGGIANLSLLPSGGDAVQGFDCGPANALMDHWCQRHTGAPHDAGGAWAAGGRVLPELLARLLAEPYFARPAPKSTGRDLFHPGWLAARLGDAASADPRDVQATLAELTARTCADHLRRHGAGLPRLIVCGGGAFNVHLMQRLAALLPGVAVESSAAHGLPPQQVEAAAFAWLAWRRLSRAPGNLPGVTGAAGPRILGAVYAA